MNAFTTPTAGLLALCLMQAAPALASTPEAVPPAQTINGITYVTGGVGQPESTAMEAAAGQYDLMVTFAKRSGAFLADIRVTIGDAAGERLLELVSGPILLLDMPDGRYRITAEHAGELEVRTITIGEGHERLAFTWP